MSEPSGADRPSFLIVERGRPSPAELAALVAVLAARRGSGAVPAPEPDRSAWSAPVRLHRHIGQPGTGAWRASAHPR